jgi:RNA polymerase sigma-70 factor (ECF subfamily)
MRKSENASLIRQPDEGDERYFTRLFELFFEDVKTYAYYRLRDETEAEDVAQDLFLDLWKKKGWEKIRLDLRTYLISAVHNRCITRSDRNRNRAIKNQKYADDVDLELARQLLLDKDSEIIPQVKEVLKGVPRKSRVAFEMIYFEQLSFKEAAAKANVSEATLKSQVQLVLKVLRQKLGSKKAKGSSKKVLMLFIYFLSQSCLQ